MPASEASAQAEEGGAGIVAERWPDSPNSVETSLERRRYDRIAGIYDLGQWPMEKLVYGRLRRALFRRVDPAGRFLEVGVGTGRNLAHYPASLSATAIDLSPRMLRRAALRARRLGVAVELATADAQALPFEEDSFDTVLATFVFCSVPNALKGLRELGRVCKPNGRILLLEHVRPQGRIFGGLVDLLDPLVVRLWGAHINRATVSTAIRAGLHVRHEQTRLGIFRMLEMAPGAGDGQRDD